MTIDRDPDVRRRPREGADDPRYALALATAWIEVMDEAMPVTAAQCTRIASEFLRFKALSDADIAAARKAGRATAVATLEGLGWEVEGPGAEAGIEAVARAICLANRDDPDKEWLSANGRRDILGWQQYEDDARAAIAAIAVMAPESRPGDDGWLPISTAPHDELVIVYCGRLEEVVEAIRYREGGWISWGANGGVSCRPTHWRHKPKPPCTADGGSR